jgi:hypothetical protein
MRKVFWAAKVFRVDGVSPCPRPRSFDQQPISLPHEDCGLSAYVDSTRFGLAFYTFWIVSVSLPSFLNPGIPTERTGFPTIHTVRLSCSPLWNSLSKRVRRALRCVYLGEHGNL